MHAQWQHAPAYRSATNAAPYSSTAVSANGAKSKSDTCHVNRRNGQGLASQKGGCWNAPHRSACTRLTCCPPSATSRSTACAIAAAISAGGVEKTMSILSRTNDKLNHAMDRTIGLITQRLLRRQWQQRQQQLLPAPQQQAMKVLTLPHGLAAWPLERAVQELHIGWHLQAIGNRGNHRRFFKPNNEAGHAHTSTQAQKRPADHAKPTIDHATPTIPEGWAARSGRRHLGCTVSLGWRGLAAGTWRLCIDGRRRQDARSACLGWSRAGNRIHSHTWHAVRSHTTHDFHRRAPAMSLFSMRRATSAPSSTDSAKTDTQSSR